MHKKYQVLRQMQAGIDEVGRGCWAGPLLAAVVVLDTARPIRGLADSKQLSKAIRERLAVLIENEAAAYGIGWVWPDEIDLLGLTTSVGLAMERAMATITVQYDDLIIDGNCNFLLQNPLARTLVKADALVPAVSAASIIAKVARDRYMAETAHVTYPDYGFDKHVGYGTRLHIERLKRHGATPIHRRSYKPIQQLLLQSAA